MIIESSSGHHWGVSKKSCQLKNCALANSMPICNRQSSGKFRKRKKGTGLGKQWGTRSIGNIYTVFTLKLSKMDLVTLNVVFVAFFLLKNNSLKCLKVEIYRKWLERLHLGIWQFNINVVDTFKWKIATITLFR